MSRANPLYETVVAVNVQKIVGLLVLAILVFFLFTNPTGAAATVQSILGTLRAGAEAVITFIQTLV